MRDLPIDPGPAPALAGVILDRHAPSRPDLKQELIDAAAAALEERGLIVAEERHWLVLVLDEAVMNAMLHGNEGDPGLDIRLRVAVAGGQWTIQIDDRGQGFDTAAIPDLEDPETLLLEHGRGVRLMREWLDDLRYYRGGATVVMRRRCRQDGADHA